MKNSNISPALGDIVKVYYKQEKNGNGGYIPNHEFGIIVKLPIGKERISLKQSYEKYELNEINFFLEHTQVRFI